MGGCRSRGVAAHKKRGPQARAASGCSLPVGGPRCDQHGPWQMGASEAKNTFVQSAETAVARRLSQMPSHPLVTRLTRSPEDQPAAPAARYSLAHADGPESSSVFGRTPAPKVPAMLGGRCQSAGSTILQCTFDSSFMWTHFSQHQEEGVDSDGRGSAHGRNSAWPFRMKHFSTR